MKVAKNKSYGPPSSIVMQEVDEPIVQPNDVLVQIHYSSVNRTDDGFLRGKPFVTRFFTGLIRPRFVSVGCEFSGIVDRVGDEVNDFKPGDRVFGFDDQDFGGYAEYKAINQDKMIVKIPDNISLEQAAVALEGAHYALFYIYKIKKDSKVFVNGGTGAIGSAAVQLLKAHGFYVEASSTTKEVGTVKKLGADKVIDWQKQDISERASECDVYFDAVGKSTFKEARKILKPGGLYMSSELGPYGQNPLLSLINPIQRIFTRKNIKFPIPKTRKLEAEMIVKHLEDGSFVPLIDKKFNINEIQDAFDYVESGQKVGNVLIEVKNS
jgi:NADPH:quinone reductase-like Zn-dependent oxidoreductase